MTVIAAVQTLPEAVTFLSSALTSASSDGRPQVVLMGGGFNTDDYNTLSTCVDGAQEQVAWMRPVHFQSATTVAPPTGYPAPEHVAGRVRKGADAARDGLKRKEGWGSVFYY